MLRELRLRHGIGEAADGELGQTDCPYGEEASLISDQELDALFLRDPSPGRDFGIFEDLPPEDWQR
jgi:hypothetical protein